MCGIFGWQWITAPAAADALVFAATLATFNDERGGDSWGWAAPNGQTDKGVGLFSEQGAINVIAELPTVIAHTRYKTYGAVTKENAHPFRVKHIIGAHNGAVFNRAELDRKLNRKCDVDSMHIFHHLAEDRDISELEGYGAIEFLDDTKPNDVFIGKFDRGDLCLARVTDESKKTTYGLAWSSSRRHLEIALKMAGFDSTIIPTADRILYRLDQGIMRRTGRKLNVYGMKGGNKHSSTSYHGIYPGTGTSYYDATLNYQRQRELEEEIKTNIKAVDLTKVNFSVVPGSAAMARLKIATSKLIECKPLTDGAATTVATVTEETLSSCLSCDVKTTRFLCSICECCQTCCSKDMTSIRIHEEASHPTTQSVLAVSCGSCTSYSTFFCNTCDFCSDCCMCTAVTQDIVRIGARTERTLPVDEELLDYATGAWMLPDDTIGH